MELPRKHRPKTVSELVGQVEVRKMMAQWFGTSTTPQTILLSGPTGCGKTTIARIIRRQLKISSMDWNEFNAATDRGIEVVRTIEAQAELNPMKGEFKAWNIDEAHQLTTAAQHGFLKLLEEPPRGVFFILSTTNPKKLLPTIRSRCTDIVVKNLTMTELKKLVKSIGKKEKKTLTDDVVEEICKAADGSARKALVVLGSIIKIKTEKDQLEVISKVQIEKEAIDVARILMRPTATWNDVKTILKDLGDDQEKVRHTILGYASACMLNPRGPKARQATTVGRAYLMIQCFRDHFYDSGKAGLYAACYEVLYGSDTD